MPSHTEKETNLGYTIENNWVICSDDSQPDFSYVPAHIVETNNLILQAPGINIGVIKPICHKAKSLKGLHPIIGGHLCLNFSDVETIDYFPEEIDGFLYLIDTKIKSFKNIHHRLKIFSGVIYLNNLIHVENIFDFFLIDPNIKFRSANSSLDFHKDPLAINDIFLDNQVRDILNKTCSIFEKQDLIYNIGLEKLL